MVDYGTAEYNGQQFTLEEDATYYGEYEKGIKKEGYRARAHDQQGKSCEVYWNITNPEALEDCEQCEWDSPSNVEYLKGE